MSIKSTITILLIGIAQGTFAWPIDPEPLRVLIINAECIVYADVMRIERVKDEDDYWSTKAILLIRETLQGEIIQDTIAVTFLPEMSCPSPPEYEAGTQVLAFLDKRKGGEGYVTHAESYGQKNMYGTDYDVFKRRIIEMQEILSLKNEEEKASRTIDWLVACAAHPATRWEGSYELSLKRGFMTYYDEEKKAYFREYALSDRQKFLLRNSFFEIEDIGCYDVVELLLLVEKENDIELLNFLIDKVKKTDPECLFIKGFLFKKIALLSGREDLKVIVDEMKTLNEMSWMDFEDDIVVNREGEKEIKLDELARKFIALL